jgi:light-regulated signal transduction histidine kinase (bacteriophytochrome)
MAKFGDAYQVFSNLTGNTIKHNDRENPEIHVSRLGEAEQERSATWRGR